MEKKPVLILGIGNYLMGDEGLGVHLARTLETMHLPDGIEVVDGGTGGFHLLELFEQYHHIILADATLNSQEVGVIRLIRPRFAADFPRAMSTHDIGLKDLVSALQLLGKMPDIHLYVVNIESIQQQGIELTREIRATLPTLMTEVIELASSFAERYEIALA
jgi:hydrogenase maturation protease